MEHLLSTASVFSKAVTKHISFPDLIRPIAPLKLRVHQKAIDSIAFLFCQHIDVSFHLISKHFISTFSLRSK